MLLKRIIDGAVSADSNLEEVLRLCKVLAAKLGSEPLENWLLLEANGYPDDAKLPDYRVWPAIVKASFSGAFGRSLTNWQVPPALLPESCRNEGYLMRCGDSVSVIAHTIASSSSQSICVELGDLSLILGDRTLEGMNCISAWGEFHTGRYAEVLNIVRNRVLDFALALSKHIPEGTEASDVAIRTSSEQVNNIFNTTVLSGTATVIGEVRDSRLHFEIRVGDFEDIASVLRKNGIDDDDLEQLKTALDEDPNPNPDEPFGPCVSAWLGGMVRKAASGAWKIAAPVATALLTKAITSYYFPA